MLAIYLVWGGAYLSVKVALSGSAPITVLQLQSTRMWCASALLAAMALLRCGMPRNLRRGDLGICALSGVLMWVAGNGLATFSSRHATSSFVVMSMGAIPLWICIIDLIIARSLPSRRVMLGLVLGLGGLFLVMAPTLLGTAHAIIAPGFAGITTLALIGAGVSWSFGTIVQRPLMTRMPAEWAAAFQMFSAACVLTVAAGIEHAPFPGIPDARQFAGFGFLVVFASAIGLTSYIRVLRSFRPVVASTFAYVNPVVGVVLGWLLLGEELSPVSLAGLAVVLASIAIVLTGRR
ncbi:EamA family transporter [Ancylobacter sp. 6x-1]|uniref:EamA family transporter n=1 Tax=Ancylobacter crimeensis TaxID=2579147 RepID=A0ABT0DG26_9HYPH|nr:EamA family transporter [Ancylobacter crimeensis]MCK0198913.1 EamA family transporter [Ancylobacter crimeensis]